MDINWIIDCLNLFYLTHLAAASGPLLVFSPAHRGIWITCGMTVLTHPSVIPRYTLFKIKVTPLVCFRSGCRCRCLQQITENIHHLRGMTHAERETGADGLHHRRR